MKRFIATIAFVIPLVGFSAPTNGFDIADLPLDRVQEGVDPKDAPNERDEQGRQQGMWIIWGRDKPEKGYPEEGRIEEGPYKDGRKNGVWIKYHKDGITPRLSGTYVNNRPNGVYTKFYDTGKVKEEGKFYAGKQVEVFKTYHPNGQVQQEKTFNDDGKEDGLVTMYFANGIKEFEYNKKEGVTTGTATRYYPNGDVKEVINYAGDGSVTDKEEIAMVNAPVDPDAGNESANNNSSEVAPKGNEGTTKNGKKFKPNDYNKVYNDDDELWMDGDFQSGVLWDGKLYKYDSDGILLKIEIWKEGKYHSDGQL